MRSNARRSERSEADPVQPSQAYITPSGAAVTAPVTEYATSLNTMLSTASSTMPTCGGFRLHGFHQAAPCSVIPVRLRLRWSWLSEKVCRSCRQTCRNFNDEAKNLSHGQGGWDLAANERNINLSEKRRHCYTPDRCRNQSLADALPYNGGLY